MNLIGNPFGEKLIVSLLEDYLKNNYYLTERELVVNSNYLDLEKITGQKTIRIDLAGLSRLDASIIFIEAETEAYIDHPAMYRPMADYVFLACPLDKIKGENVNQVAVQKLIQAANKYHIGILGVFRPLQERDPCFETKVNAPLLYMNNEVRNAVLKAFEQRGYGNMKHYIPWWAHQ